MASKVLTSKEVDFLLDEWLLAFGVGPNPDKAKTELLKKTMIAVSDSLKTRNALDAMAKGCFSTGTCGLDGLASLWEEK